MKDLFEYYEDDAIRGIKVIIGTYVSHQIKWIKDNGELLSVDEVNNLDRMKLAQDFFNKRTMNGKYKSIGSWYKTTRSYEEYELINDIAQFIDMKIPKSYWIRLYEKELGHYEDRSKTSKLYKGINTIDNLKFFYEDNYYLEFHW